MTKTITELWYGTVAPYCQHTTENRELKQKEEALLQCQQQFQDRLDEEVKKRFRRLLNRQQEYWQASREHAFCQGFSLGMKLAAEAMLTAETATDDMARSL